MRTMLVLSAVFGLAMIGPTARAEGPRAAETSGKVGGKVPPVLTFKMKDVDGKELDLSKYKGKVILFVNVASKCGLTNQYEGLQELYARYEKKGLVVIGVPANEFGEQEPGTNAQIKKFCKDNYSVTFPMTSKVVVKGKGITPLYAFLTSKKSNPKFAGDVEWNFTKFLVSRKGEVVNRFAPRTTPEAKEVIDAIEAELKK